MAKWVKTVLLLIGMIPVLKGKGQDRNSGTNSAPLTPVQQSICATIPEEASPAYPLRDLRGAWITSVFNLDWPKNRLWSVQEQQQELLKIMDTLVASGFNTLFLQVRTGCDALYASSYEPWSYYLTGTEGQAPAGGWDPLSFAISAAHSRGLQLHAWLNPYRTKTGSFTHANNHVSNLKPHWILEVGTNRVLNPGLPEVITYLKKITADIASRYAVDGIHFDDYFYPKGITTQDNATYLTNNPAGFSTIGDWRRDNVNRMIEAVNDTLKKVQINTGRQIVFGVSPAGIWKSNTPLGIIGQSAYSELYCDALAWMQAGSIDYLAPQLYWKIGGPQDYDKLSKWWNDQGDMYKVPIFPGHAWYKMDDTNNWEATELVQQTMLNRDAQRGMITGQIGYRTHQLMTNSKGVLQQLRADVHKYPSIAPPLGGDQVCPNPPMMLQSDAGVLQWNAPLPASDGDTARSYLIFAYDDQSTMPTVMNNGAKVVAKTTRNFFYLNSRKPVTYAVVAVDKNNNLSTAAQYAFNALHVCPGETGVLKSQVVGTSFQWQQWLDSSWRNIDDGGGFTGTQTASLTLPAAGPALQNGRFRCIANNDTPGPEMQVFLSNDWTGAGSNLWSNQNNWYCGALPTTETDVRIPAGITIFPVVDLPFTQVRSIWLGQGSKLEVQSGKSLEVLH